MTEGVAVYNVDGIDHPHPPWGANVVLASALPAILEAERERIRELQAKLADAAEMVAGWGAYASDYFQEKWDLEADIQTLLQAALAVAYPEDAA